MSVQGTVNLETRYRLLEVGDPAPWFVQRATNNPAFEFNSVGGRYVVLCFYASAGDRHGQEALKILAERRDLFNDDTVTFFGVSLDRDDEAQGRVQESVPGVRFFWDFDGAASRLYGVVPVDAPAGRGRVPVQRKWVLLDPMLRVRAIVPFRDDGGDRQEVIRRLEALPPIERFAGFPLQAPVLVLPNVFEPALCRELIGLYEAHGGEESGFMRELEGKTVMRHDHSFKRRRDVRIKDDTLKHRIAGLIERRIVPEVHKAYQFQVTRMERYIVVCYDSATQGHFRPHRDNTTKGTAHRRFAVTVNLNADYEGGDLRFREYGQQWIKPPPGGAVVFSCSLLHEVSPVVRGKRYAFLPFLYDDAAAAIREANNKHLGEDVGAYRKMS